MKSTTAITEVFGDGQKLTAVAVEYDKEIDGSKLARSAFSVAGRTVTKVYANTEATKAVQGKNGRFVVVELSPSDEAAALFVQRGRTTSLSEAHVVATQVGEITTVAGEKLAPDDRPLSNDRVVDLVVDDFQQFEYAHPATGIVLKYNLFVPRNYDKNKSYPLVTFVHDRGATSDQPKTTLVQGLGAVVWASPAEQAKHECFVLAPQYSTQIVNDDSDDSEYVDITVDLIKSVAAQYNIDTNRLYATGQSGGCMMFIAVNIKYPDLLAASLLVAGQWDPALVAPLAKANLWIVVSEGDLKAFSGMNAITATLESEGARVSRAAWSGQASAAEFASEVSSMLAEGDHIMYTVLEKGTVVPPGMPDDSGSNHVCTWRIAYQIEGIRDWLFAQSRPTNRPCESCRKPARPEREMMPPWPPRMLDTSHVKRKWLDIPYAGQSPAQKLDIYLPHEGEGPFPVVMQLHGGAWLGGDKAHDQARPMLKGIDRGFAVVCVNHRLSGEALFPSQIYDCKAAVRFIKANAAKYNLDGDRIAVWGASAGAYLCALVGTSAHVRELEDLSMGNGQFSSKVQAIVDWCGPAESFLRMDEEFKESGLGVPDHSAADSPESKLLGDEITRIPELVEWASPMTHITPDVPYFLIQHGELDQVVPVQQSINFAAQLEKIAGREKVILEVLPGIRHHGDPGLETPANVDRVFRFLESRLK